MSYNIQIFSTETKEKEKAADDDSFFDREENLIPFTQGQVSGLKERLLKYKYNLVSEDETGLHFNHPDEDFGSALLTDKGLYFNASLSESSIFEVGMTASEFTDTGEFAKYDPQNEGWEEF
ncbi:hypothetical protein B0A69_18280 [Chryseobacterium shigense]|uniref:Uncharacterized protein n=1 Tax=Chryseobacterium shigense TaxID=297244 RepID=A0A1N7KAW7_9FLAO|nr:hypothetical protein [Chryseobacterium shigense]PQA91197.1 hypothetical protein B0A69_18280 [Chryseobacterium shigense]SIS58746.1 hypothetical protein SAMN05421639_10945 [Chryseobacterium shigense]